MAQPDFKKYDVKAANNLAFGQGGTYTESGTTAWTGYAVAIQCLTDTTFAVFTEVNGDGDPLTAQVFLAGSIIYGNITAMTLTSGMVRIYLGTAQPT